MLRRWQRRWLYQQQQQQEKVEEDEEDEAHGRQQIRTMMSQTASKG